MQNYTGNMRALGGDGNVLYVDCINVSILVVIQDYRYATYDHWGKLKKGYMGSLYIISCNECESMSTSK